MKKEGKSQSPTRKMHKKVRLSKSNLSVPVRWETLLLFSPQLPLLSPRANSTLISLYEATKVNRLFTGWPGSSSEHPRANLDPRTGHHRTWRTSTG